MQDVAGRKDGSLKLSPGTLYGSIKRMREEGLVVEVDARPSRDEDDEDPTSRLPALHESIR